MRGCLAILRARYSTLMQYRGAAFAGICTQLFWGLIMVMILKAFFHESRQSQPLTFSQAATFVLLAQALLQLVPWTIDKELEAQVKGGNVVYELVRPLDLYWLWFSRALAMRLTPTLLRAVPIFILAGLFLELSAPVSAAALFSFMASLIFSIILSAAITTCVIISLFWTLSGEGIQRLMPHMTVLLSGLVVPIPLFPSWLQPFMLAQPFRAIIDIPSRLYTGVIPASEAIFYLAFQLVWAVFFIFLGKKLMQKALKQFVVQGG